MLDGKPCQMVFTDPPYNVDYVGKGPGRMKLANDNLGTEFAMFLRSACDALLAVADGPVYICMSSSELATLQSAFLRCRGPLVDVDYLDEEHVYSGPRGLPTPIRADSLRVARRDEALLVRRPRPERCMAGG